ncbi:MAG: aspartate--tRNA ligase [Gammaproteobacteria bacterium]|tara:strand:- start:107 stop:1873 length:1767 start_codon:yes stop_codon:yes gene_type:complete
MRTYYCNEINESKIDTEVQVCGWVNKIRDHGGVIFIDLRDIKGLVQIIVNPDDKNLFSLAESIRSEFIISVTGKPRSRPKGSENLKINSGKVEIVSSSISLLSRAETPPFQFDDDVNEDSRLKYRVHDLKSMKMQKNLIARNNVVNIIRSYLSKLDFLEIETPILTKATPEGARDYLVPSRVNQGEFYALPQSPQLFKQMLMMSGYEKYYQIAKCFRDEDLRADRQPEFTQLDLEISFTSQSEIISLIENLFEKIFNEILQIKIDLPIQKISYHDAMDRFGSDRPDMRIPFEIKNISEIVKDSDFKVFSKPASENGQKVSALCIPSAAKLSRKDIDNYTDMAISKGSQGLAYIKCNDVNDIEGGLQSPIIKFLDKHTIEKILKNLGALDGDIIFFSAGPDGLVNNVLGSLRCKIAEDKDLVKDDWKFVWITDFPMFDYDKETKKWKCLHHPFTMPVFDNIKDINIMPNSLLSKSYDLVLNGTELGGGSIRINDIDIQNEVFKVLGLTEEEINNQFGFFINSMKYGCPPHGGIAFGLDRIIMLLTKSNSIREVIAFPKTQTASCSLTNAPASISKDQMRELGLKNKEKE